MENVMKKLNALLTLSAVLLAGSFANAAILASWENDHLTGSEVSTTAGESPSAGTILSGISVAQIGRGAGATATNYADTFAMRNNTATSLTNAITANRYWDVTLTASAGNTMNLDSFAILLSAQDASAVGTASVFTLRSSLTGTTDLATYTVGGTGNANDTLGAAFNTTLSGFTALQGISTVNFYLYGWTQNATRNQYAQVGIGRTSLTNGTNDLVISGTITVPEPGTLAFAAIALGTCVLFLRRKK